MKKGMTFLFEAKWWASNQPKGLKSAGDLESALKAYESAKGKLEKSDDADREKAAGAAKAALDGVDKAVEAVIKESSKAKGNAEMEITVEVLKKFGGKRDLEKKWIDEQAASDDNMFANSDVFRSYLLTQCKRLRSSGEMNFGLVLGKKAEEHRLALHKAKSAKALGNMLVKETGLHQFTFGVATTSEERAGVLVLWLEGRQLPGIAKKGARMLKKFKPLPFTKLALMVDGQEVADIDDPEDTDTDDLELDAPDGVSAPAKLSAAALTQELAELVRRIQGIADPALKGDLARKATQANALLRSNSLEEAKERIDQLRTALDEAGAAANGGNGVAQAAGGTTNATLAESMPADARLSWSDMGDRLKAVAGDASAYGMLDHLSGALRVAAEQVLSRDQKALETSDLIEEQMATLLRERRMSELDGQVETARSRADQSLAQTDGLRLQLRLTEAVVAEASANLEAALEALLATPDFDQPATLGRNADKKVSQAVSRVPDPVALITTLEPLVEQLGGGLPADERSALIGQGDTAIAEYQALLSQDELLTFMESTSAGPFPIASLVESRLRELSKALHGAA